MNILLPHSDYDCQTKFISARVSPNISRKNSEVSLTKFNQLPSTL